MPFQFVFDTDNRLVTMTGTGQGNADSVQNAIVELQANPAFVAGYGILIDGRKLDFTPTAAEIRAFVAYHLSQESLRRSKVAIVVARLQDFGMANMFATLCDLNDAPVRSFMSIEDAQVWLATSWSAPQAG